VDANVHKPYDAASKHNTTAAYMTGTFLNMFSVLIFTYNLSQQLTAADSSIVL